jgi:hypothetical protein
MRGKAANSSGRGRDGRAAIGNSHRDCKNEYTQFTDCMKMERMRIQSLPADILINLDKYQYI